MKRFIFLFVSISLIFLFGGNVNAAFNSGSTGADGPFNPAATPTPQVPPGTVISGTTATVPLSVSGIFNFTTVNVPSGWTVNFTKNAANTPVYILAQGDVTIAGTLNVAGKSSKSSAPGIEGPGGFNGGYGAATGALSGNGLGPGGGGGSKSDCSWGGGGGFGTLGGQFTSCGSSGGGNGGPAYGNARLIPLIGGSGGGGSGDGYGGGGGGGAILIASSGNITITGTISANGGDGYYVTGWTGYHEGGGSGGAIRLIANIINGSGFITAKGGSIGSQAFGGQGRIRIEAYTNNFTPGTDPPYTYGQPGSVFPANEPSLWITSIAGNVPVTRTGSYSNPDILLPSTTTNPVTVNVSAAYIPVGTTVTVSVIPQYGSSSSVNTTLSGVLASTTATASVNLSTQYSNVVMAQATYTIQTAMFYDGEKIEKVRVAATMGKESETVYITESGKEIPAKELKMAGLVK